jgi:NAD-dependent deacetylase
VYAGEWDPPCRACGGILKSATISFGQALVDADLERASAAASSCDLLLALGSTLGVFPIAGVVPLAHGAGAKIVIINGSKTEMDELASVRIQGLGPRSLSQCLPRIIDLVSF